MSRGKVIIIVLALAFIALSAAVGGMAQNASASNAATLGKP